MKKQIKKAASLIIALAIMATSSAVSAAEGYKLIIDGKETPLAHPVIYSDGYNLVPLGEIMRYLAAEVTWDAETKTVTATKEENEINVTIGSLDAYVNGSPVTLDIAPRIVDDVTYVPVGFIAKSLGYEVGWSADTKTVSLDTPSAERGRVDITFKNRYETNLTLTEANSIAISQSKDLKTLRNTMEDLRNSRDDIASQSSIVGVSVSNLPVAAINDTTNTIRSTLASIETMSNKLFGEQYQREMYQGTLALTVKSSFLGIENAQDNIALTEAQIELSKRALDNNKLMLDLGMVSQVDYDKAELEHKKLVESQAKNERALDTEYNALNKVLGYDASKRYNIVYDADYAPVKKDFLLDNYVTVAVAASPTVKLAELSVTSAQNDLKLFTGTNLEYQQKETAVNTASLNLEDTKRTLENNIRNAYDSIKDIETQIASAEIDLQKAKTDAETARVRYETGEITQLELLQKLYAVDSTEISIALLKQSHGVSKFRFEQPYLLSRDV